MKCPVCKYLNNREEARKHLNSQTIQNLGNATKNLHTLEQALIGVVYSNCNLHNDHKILAAHLRTIGAFAGDLMKLIAAWPLGVPDNRLKALLLAYPDPRNNLTLA